MSHSSPDNRQASRAGVISILVNAILFGLKYWAGLVTGSVALVADAWHTLSDSISSVMVLVGINISNKPADKEHPFGHGRAEIITALLIGAILGFIGFNFLVESIQRLKSQNVVSYGLVAKIVTVISILFKEGLAQYSFWIGRKTNSESLKADAWHHRSDALSSIIILIGIFAGGNYWWMDGSLGIIVSVLIFYATYEILSTAIHKLLGEKPDEQTINKLKEISRKITSRELYLHHTHIHNYGNHQEITFHIRLPSDMTLEEAHEIATRIEQRIQEELQMQATIHMEPLHKIKS
ncbi:MAG: cation diffusion facilitator family transporter [Candidatus Cyclobacteriaceae bacterium M3_2C_046]